MGFVLGLVQCGYPDEGDVLGQVRTYAEEASRCGVSLLVFPEDLMSPRSLTPPELRRIAEPLDGPFICGVAECAREQGLWIVCTFYERNPADGAPYNTAAVIDDAGVVRATYRKCHLYDAHGVFESERYRPGDALFESVDSPFGRLGLAICYDLRFPEVARHAAFAGCELLLYPSAWLDGPQKRRHWETLLTARAIENELFVAGVCKAGERYVGDSLVADPLGCVLARAEDKGAQLLTCEIDLAAVVAAREAMPLLSHRRPELY